MKKQPECFLLWMALLLIPLSVIANNAIPMTNESPPPLDLQLEPIQPLYLPKALNAGKVALGERLFNEPRLAHDNNMSCASCHILKNGGANCQERARGRDGVELGANSLTVFNSSLNHRLFWDGRAKTLEEQIDFVVTGAHEFATQWPVLINKLKQDEEYQKSFEKLYSDGITATNVRNAIATFERSLITVNSRFDRYLKGEVDAINAMEKSGYRLFKDYGCIACHQGRNVGGNMFQKLGAIKEFFGNGNPVDQDDLGRFNVTGKERDRHVFRVPPLRLAILTAPYFHDGSTENLYDAVKIMAKYQLGRTISDTDIEHIIAFLGTLPGEYKGQPLSGVQKENIISKPEKQPQ